MKRISLLVLFFFCCSFVHPFQARSAPPLALLAPAVIGATVAVVAGTTYALKNPDSGFSFDGYAIGRDLYAFTKIAAAGGEYVLGRSVRSFLDAAQAVKENAFSGYAYLQGLYNSFMASVTETPPPKAGDVLLGDNGAKIKLGQEYPGNNWQTFATFNSSYSRIVPGTNLHYYGTNTLAYLDESQPHATLPGYFMRMIVPYTTTTDPVNYDPDAFPDEWQDDMAPALGQHINNALQSGGAESIAIGEELDDFQREHPGLWALSDGAALPENPTDISDYPPAQPINPAEINQWAQSHGANAQQSYIDYLQSLVDANPGDTSLAAQLAQAQADQAKQEAEDVKDSFGQITDNPFESPYNPGSFDIPARFTTFLNNVQSTGLFSFSSSYFNSLPGGGSPVYTVDAGTYGIHTIDLSETMSTGLAVLKTVLLLLFGFLSIRVVILKR